MDEGTDGAGLRSIPARAGEPPPSNARRRRSKVYPRPCGGTWPKTTRRRPCRGLSPPVRGNHIDHRGRLRGRRHRVYPRPCGGTTSTIRQIVAPSGLSPPVRGNPWECHATPSLQGSIPARAGEPSPPPSASPGPSVYPRPCGGTPKGARACPYLRGLSPPVRGNHLPSGLISARGRSIPARAGEPANWQLLSGQLEVYPRPCGGTQSPLDPDFVSGGLSPPVRGNRAVVFSSA